MTSLDPFDSGAIWSQTIPTQAHREAWKRCGHPRSDEADFKAIDIVGQGEAVEEEQDDDLLEQPTAESSRPACAQQRPPAAAAAADDAGIAPWWKNGKTAPLLQDFDQGKRMWYMAQAGIFQDQATGIHSANATEASRSSNLNNLTTPIAPQRAALSLAGNVNSPIAPSAAAETSMETTTTTHAGAFPRRKTWQTTIAKRNEKEKSESSRGEKRRR